MNIKSIIIILIILLTGCQSNESLINNGLIHIAEDDTFVTLNGEWNFYPNRLVNPVDIPNINPKKMLVPGYWENDIHFGTYHLQIQFPEDKVGHPQAIYIPQVYSAYKLWINQEFLIENGNVDSSKENMVPKGTPTVVLFTVPQQTIDITMQVSNVTNRNSGISSSINIGEPDKIARKRIDRFIVEWFSIGALLLIGLTQINTYLSQRRETVSLYFGIFCLLIAFRVLLVGEAYIFYFFPHISWELVLRLNYTIIFACIPLFIKYFSLISSTTGNSRLLLKFSTIVSLLCIFIILVMNGYILTHTIYVFYSLLILIFPYFLVIFIRGIKNRQVGAKLIFFFLLFLIGTVVNDLMYDEQLIDSIILTPLGLVAFCGVQSSIISKRFAIAAMNVESLSKELELTQKETFLTLGEITETRSKETGKHVQRVGEYAKLLAFKYGLTCEEAELIRIASALHDIGKVAITDSILNKPGKLTEEEYSIIKTHTTLGYKMLNHSKRKLLETAATIAYTHHEKYDGSGYPRGLSGKDIPVYGRIVAIADVFDALGTKRVYKTAWDIEQIRDYFESQKGKHFDPTMVKIFLDNIEEFIEIHQHYRDEKKER